MIVVEFGLMFPSVLFLLGTITRTDEQGGGYKPALTLTIELSAHIKDRTAYRPMCRLS